MAGSREGGLKAAKINRTKYGSDFYARIGSKGGKKKGPKGFALMPTWKVSAAGRKGGLKRGEDYGRKIREAK